MRSSSFNPRETSRFERPVAFPRRVRIHASRPLDDKLSTFTSGLAPDPAFHEDFKTDTSALQDRSIPFTAR